MVGTAGALRVDSDFAPCYTRRVVMLPGSLVGRGGASIPLARSY